MSRQRKQENQDQVYNRTVEAHVQWENHLYELRDEVTTGEDVAFHRIDQTGLDRIFQHMSGATAWAIFTAYRDEYSKAENVRRNRNLRATLNARKLGVHPLVGHWRECTLKRVDGKPIPYDECPEDNLGDVIERSYFIVKPVDWDAQRFEDLIFSLAAEYDQDALVFAGNGKAGVYDPGDRTEYESFSSNTPNVEVIARAYSRYGKKMNVPFVFEGIETPNALGYGMKAIRNAGFRWAPLE